jgi:hypothetical protein
MGIENIRVYNKTCILKTTGGIFHIDLEKGTIQIGQRIGTERVLAEVMLGPNWFKESASPILKGFDCIWAGLSTESPRMIISGDSVIRFYNIEKLRIKLQFSLRYHKVNRSNGGLLALDNDGGLAIIPPQASSNEDWPKTFADNTWELSATRPLSILFIGICPPRQYDWDSSFSYNVHYSSHTQRYPTDEQIVAYSKYAQVLEMHSWIWQNRYNEDARDDKGKQLPLWRDYSSRAQNYKWIPDSDIELKRVIKTAHAYGMKVVPYVNFVKNDIKMPITDVLAARMGELERLRDTYGFDGFYIDGLFHQDPESSYTVARSLRELLGEKGWLTLHDTRSSGYFFPFVNAYMDLIITSEHESFDRWKSTSYKISNALASVWPEIPIEVKDGRGLLKELIDNSLRYNNRIVLMDGKDGQWRRWRLYFTDDEMKFVQEYLFQGLEGMKNKYMSEGADMFKEKVVEVTPQYGTEIDFADEILFLGYDLNQASMENMGTDYLITFYFKLLKPVTEDMDIYLHIDNVVAQDSLTNTNMQFAEGKPHYWELNQIVSKTYSFFVPTEDSLEDYRIQIGLWDHKHIRGHIEIDDISESTRGSQ